MNKESFEFILGNMLECLNRALSLQKIGLHETAEIILHDNIQIGGKMNETKIRYQKRCL